MLDRLPPPPRPVLPIAPREVMRTFDFVSIAGRFPALAHLVEDVADWDIPDAAIACGVAVTILPSIMPHLVLQYRAPTRSLRQFGDAVRPHRAYRHVASLVQTGIVTSVPSGPLGLISVRLKPEAAASLLGDRLYEFADQKIDLDAIFGASAVATLAETLAEARSGDDRITVVLEFLFANIQAHQPDPVVCRAAASLRQNPGLRLGLLAADLGLGERQLIRRFKAVFGTGPKRFARTARMEKVFAACGAGLSFANVACACGFSDQAHMINDFKSILGVTPTDLFRAPSRSDRAIVTAVAHPAPTRNSCATAG